MGNVFMPIIYVIISHLIRFERIGHLLTLNFVWLLRDGERSSRVKIADRGFASRQSASLVSIERGKLRRFVLCDGRELCVPLERLKVTQLFNLIDLERRTPNALDTINCLHQLELLSQNSQRLVRRIGQEPCNQAPTNAAHAIEIDLGFGDPSRVLQRLGVCVTPCNRARNRLRHR